MTRSRIPGPTCGERGSGILDDTPGCAGREVVPSLDVLNADISLTEFNSTYTYNGRLPREFFRRGRATSRDLLPAGTMLWKCTDRQLNSRRGYVTEWWLHGDRLAIALKHSLGMGTSLRTYCRARYAVIWEWRSAAFHLLTARLLKPVYGFAGQTRGMGTKYSVRGQDTGDDSLALIGGDPQLCIPNLTLEEIAQVSFTDSQAVPEGWDRQRASAASSSGS